MSTRLGVRTVILMSYEKEAGKMSREDVRPSPGMRFFTPNLYLRFNSSDETEYTIADREWEGAIRAYREHLKSFIGKLPPDAKKLAGSSLHDARLINPLKSRAGRDRKGRVSHGPVMVLQQYGRIVILLHSLRGAVRTLPPVPGWRFSKEDVHWLYDELDVSPKPPLFLHRILWSDGQVIEIPFSDMVCLFLEVKNKVTVML